MDDRHDAFGHARLGGIAEVLARRIMSDTPYDARSVILGHPQRGGPPSPVDRIMGLMFGARAADAVADGDFGKMVSSRGIAPACDLSLVDLSTVLGRIDTVRRRASLRFRSLSPKGRRDVNRNGGTSLLLVADPPKRQPVFYPLPISGVHSRKALTSECRS